MMPLASRCMHRWLVICVPLVLAGTSRTSHAWAIGSQIDEHGCHELITAEALRTVRARLDTAPRLAPSRDEAAMIADATFAPPSDLVGDLAAMTLLFGVRDNDLKGIDPLSSLDLIQVHGDPTTQDEHCIRSDADDHAAGDAAALDACRAFIVRTATEALDGLGLDGRVDPTRTIPLELYVSIRGQIEPALPLFYVKMGQALHALEDGFTHVYRTAEGAKVTVVLNWIDVVGEEFDEARDGPPHRAELDRCWDDDPIIARNYELSIQAATELLTVALDPSLTRDQKVQRFSAVTAKHLGYQPGCTFENQWCASPEAEVTNSIAGCNASGGGALGLCALVGLALVVAARRRRALHATAAACLVASGFAASAHADDPPPPPPPAAAGTPIAANTAEPPTEPGRDVKTPTPRETAEIRADKKLGSPWGFAGSAGVSIARAAAAGSIGVRYRIREQWVVGVDAGWNPWVTTSPMAVRAGVATLAGTVIRRFPMKFDRVNLRSSLHLGASMLLFDVYGAPSYSIGPYGAISPLGLDYDLGGSVRIVWDPMEIALPVPLVSQLPLYYEQFRFMIGIQVGG